MAEATRFKDLQEAQKRLDQVLQSESMKRTAAESKVQEQIAGFDQKFEHITKTLAELQLQLLNLGNHSGSGSESILGGYNSGTGGKSGPFSTFTHTPLPRIEFPKFDGVNPRAWIIKCNSYFKLMPSIPDAQRVHLASMHFEGKALSWFQSLNMGEIIITWKQFLEVVSTRFDDISVSNIVVEFNKLKMTDSYEDYVEKFHELRSCLMMEDASNFSEEYFIASFISGLGEDLRSFIKMFHPQTLDQTIELGKQQIHTLNAISKRLCSDAKPFQNQSLPYGRADQPSLQGSVKISNTIITKPPTKLLTAAEMAARRNKGLCYNCDDPYFVGHRCTQRVNYILMTEDEELLDEHKLAELELQEVETNMVQHFDEVHVSLHSLIGEHGPTTMNVVGEVGNQELRILLDTGSTLSFLQEDTAKRLGCAIHNVKPLFVRVANGQRLVSATQATDFHWYVQGHQFQFSLRLLKIKGCDMILGGDWLRLCSPIELDYDNMVFTVTDKGEKIILNALNPALDNTFGNLPMLSNLSHEEIINAEAVFILDTQTIGEGVLDGSYKPAHLMPLESHKFIHKGTEFPRVPVAWLNFGSDLVTGSNMEFLRLKRPFFDPWGQGSTNPGGIVMAKEGLELEVKEDVDTEKIWDRGWCDSIFAKENK